MTRRTLPPPGSWTVYMLRCGDGSLYTGATNDLAARVERHRSGRGAAYTRSRLPVRLVFHEPVDDRSAALRREAALKKLTRKEKLALVRVSAPPSSARSTRSSPRAAPAVEARRGRAARRGTP